MILLGSLVPVKRQTGRKSHIRTSLSLPSPKRHVAEKIRGKIHYLGQWARRVNGQLARVEGDGWKEALEQYKTQADDLQAVTGRSSGSHPPPRANTPRTC